MEKSFNRKIYLYCEIDHYQFCLISKEALSKAEKAGEWEKIGEYLSIGVHSIEEKQLLELDLAFKQVKFALSYVSTLETILIVYQQSKEHMLERREINLPTKGKIAFLFQDKAVFTDERFRSNREFLSFSELAFYYEVHSNEVRDILVKSALDIAQSYEMQLQQVDINCISELAKDAAYRSYYHLRNKEHKQSNDRGTLTEAFILVECDNNELGSQIKWKDEFVNTRDLYENVGVVVPKEGNIFEFYKKKKGDNSEKYGYRFLMPPEKKAPNIFDKVNNIEEKPKAFDSSDSIFQQGKYFISINNYVKKKMIC